MRINLGPNTYDSYSGIIKWHIGARFGNYALEALTTAEIQDWINSLKEDGYSRSTVKSIFTVFNDAMRWASPTASISKSIPGQRQDVRSSIFPEKAGHLFTSVRYRLIFHAFPVGT